MKHIVLDGKAYSWRQILEIRKEQRRAARSQEQPTLFELREDSRPPSQQSASGRYLEPTLFDGVKS
jgi:hypothetical protein